MKGSVGTLCSFIACESKSNSKQKLKTEKSNVLLNVRFP